MARGRRRPGRRHPTCGGSGARRSSRPTARRRCRRGSPGPPGEAHRCRVHPRPPARRPSAVCRFPPLPGCCRPRARRGLCARPLGLHSGSTLPAPSPFPSPWFVSEGGCGRAFQGKQVVQAAQRGRHAPFLGLPRPGGVRSSSGSGAGKRPSGAAYRRRQRDRTGRIDGWGLGASAGSLRIGRGRRGNTGVGLRSRHEGRPGRPPVQRRRGLVHRERSGHR